MRKRLSNGLAHVAEDVADGRSIAYMLIAKYYEEIRITPTNLLPSEHCVIDTATVTI